MRLLLLGPLLLALAAPAAPGSYGALDRTARLDRTGQSLADAVRSNWPAAEIGIDGALSRAAEDLAARIAAGLSLEEAARGATVRLALARAGAVAPEIAPLLVRASTRALALQRTRERLADEATAAPPRLVGVGTAEAGGRFAVVLLRAPERLALQPFPSRVERGASHRLAGHLLPPLQAPSLHVTRPGGGTARLPARVEGRRFEAVIPFAEAGRHTLEVMGEGPDGPQVAAILEVWAGQPIPAEAEAPPPATEAADAAGKERLAAELVNGLRAARGLPPVRIDPVLGRVARAYAEELLRTGRFAHRSPTSGALQDRLLAAGYRYRRAGENLAQAPTVRQAHESTVQSPGHLANLVEPDWSEAGFGVALGQAGGSPTVVLVEVFAAPQGR